MFENKPLSHAYLSQYIRNLEGQENYGALIHNISTSSIVSSLTERFLKSFNLQFFVYLRIYDDGRILRVSNCDAWTLQYFGQKLYNESVFYADHINQIRGDQPRFFFWPTDSESRIYQGFQTSGLGSGLSRYRREVDHVESYSFSTGSNSFDVLNGTINQLNEIENMIDTFRSDAASILPHHDQGCMILSKYKYNQKQAESVAANEDRKLREFYKRIGMAD